MSEQQPTSAKACKVCGVDLQTGARVKDAKGNYYCQECAAKLRAKTGQKGAPGAAPAKTDADADVMSKLVNDSIEKSATSCPACRRPWKEGAVICTSCGFNKETSQMVGTQIKDPAMIRDPKAPKRIGGKGGGKKFAGAHWKVALVLIVLFGAGLAVSSQDPQVAGIFGLTVNVYMFLFGIFAAIDAYMESESALKAIAVFFCGIYAVYYGCVETDNDLLKGTAWAYVIIFLMYLIAIVALGAATAGAGFGAAGAGASGG